MQIGVAKTCDNLQIAKFTQNCDTLIGIYRRLNKIQNYSKMKKISNLALEGICNGDTVGGLLLWAWENFEALLF